MKKRTITVREIQLKDIDLIADYWLKSEPDFLVKMGVDLKKLPSRNGLKKMLTEQINQVITAKKSYALIWELNGKQIGHSNVNGIQYGEEATMHLHLWQQTDRQKGLGTEFVLKTLPFYFHKLNLKKIICLPFAQNPAPNKTLEKIGFEFVKKYKTIPGSLNFEQEVNQWELTKNKFEKITQS